MANSINQSEEELYPFNDNEQMINSVNQSEEEIYPFEKVEEESDYEYEMEEPKLQNEFCINLGDKIGIYSVYELSNKRIAVIDIESKELKIYSWKTGKLVIKITQEYIGNIIELKNNDLVINSSSSIYFYKLLPNQNYELYQTIDENKQRTKKVKELPIESPGSIEEYNLYSVYELLNGNLVSCNSYGIKIYKKDIEGKDKLSFIKKIEIEVRHVIEIKNNVLIIFCDESHLISRTFSYHDFAIYKYDIEKQELTELDKDRYSDRNFYRALYYFSYILNNKYLFVRFCFKLNVYDITKNAELIYPKGNNECPIKEFFGNYDCNIIIAKIIKIKLKCLDMKIKKIKKIKILQFYKNFLLKIEILEEL